LEFPQITQEGEVRVQIVGAVESTVIEETEDPV
jgi:hypothetical protein